MLDVGGSSPLWVDQWAVVLCCIRKKQDGQAMRDKLEIDTPSWFLFECLLWLQLKYDISVVERYKSLPILLLVMVFYHTIEPQGRQKWNTRSPGIDLTISFWKGSGGLWTRERKTIDWSVFSELLGANFEDQTAESNEDAESLPCAVQRDILVSLRDSIWASFYVKLRISDSGQLGLKNWL